MKIKYLTNIKMILDKIQSIDTEIKNQYKKIQFKTSFTVTFSQHSKEQTTEPKIFSFKNGALV